MSKQAKERFLKVAGCLPLQVLGLDSRCGDIEHGVALEFEGRGAWVVDLADLRRLVEDAEKFQLENR